MTTLSASTPPPPPITASSARKPYLSIRARRGWIGINVRELWHFRDLLWSLTGRDIKLRYKQTALGIIWVVLQPLVGALIFAYVFGRMANLPADSGAHGKPVPYFLFAFTGLVAWNLFFSIVSKLAPILVANSALVSKVYFPRLLLPLSGAVSYFVDLGVSIGLLLILQVIAGVPFTINILLAPIMLLLLTCITIGIGMWAAALCVEYRDVGFILPVILPFMMWASPVGYSAFAMTQSSHGWIYFLNPLAGLITAWRWSVLSTPFPPMWAFAWGTFAALALLMLGMLMFRRMERTFADVI